MNALFGRMLRRYAALLLVTLAAGSLPLSGSVAAAMPGSPVGALVTPPSAIDAPASPSAGASRLPGRAILRGPVGAKAERLLDRAGATVVRRIPAIDATEIRSTGDLRALSRRLSGMGIGIEPVYRGRIATSGTETCLTPGCVAPQWHHAATLASAGWTGRTGATPVQVAVLDTQVDASHPDWIRPGGTGPDVSRGGQLMTSLGRSYVTNHAGAAAYHGTFVAGLVAAAANEADAIGVAPAGVALATYAVVDGGGNTDSAALAAAIVRAWRDGARIVNLSLGILGDSPSVHDAIRLVTRGDQTTPPALVVAAAGNHTGSTAFYPGSYPEVLAVAGTAVDDSPAACSNHNPNVSVSAPADRLVGLAPMPQRLLQAPCGTSAAAPQVSGLAALLLAQDPSRTPAELRRIIEASADDLGAPGRDDRFGHGRINIARALAGSNAAGVVRPENVVAARNSLVEIDVVGRAAAGAVKEGRATLGGTAALSLADGVSDRATERLVGTVDLSGLPAGVHRLALSARDSNGWGPPVSAVVVVDADAPVISNLSAPNAVRDAFEVRFDASDAAADRVIAGVSLRALTGQSATFASGWEPNGAHVMRIKVPASLPAGRYTVTVAVADPSGNVSRTETAAVIL